MALTCILAMGLIVVTNLVLMVLVIVYTAPSFDTGANLFRLRMMTLKLDFVLIGGARTIVYSFGHL